MRCFRPFAYVFAIGGLAFVAVLSRYPLVRIQTHQEVSQGGHPVFSRDCLAVDVRIGAKMLSLFVNHFKSMLDKKDGKNGRRGRSLAALDVVAREINRKADPTLKSEIKARAIKKVVEGWLHAYLARQDRL